jgi:hypothetical protein
VQLIELPDPALFVHVENALQRERLMRYMPAAGGDVAAALQLYLWNCALCESFFVSLHFAEVVCRNAIHRRLVERLGESWFGDPLFVGLLDPRYRNEIEHAIDDETKQHAGWCTAHHVVSALTFGFWQHLLTKRFDRLLWSQGMTSCFPAAPAEFTREDAYLLVERIRRWRNRIAHHRAIFDKKPMRTHQDVLRLIRSVSGETGGWVASISRVPVAISLRPR